MNIIYLHHVTGDLHQELRNAVKDVRELNRAADELQYRLEDVRIRESSTKIRIEELKRKVISEIVEG